MSRPNEVILYISLKSSLRDAIKATSSYGSIQKIPTKKCQISCIILEDPHLATSWFCTRDRILLLESDFSSSLSMLYSSLLSSSCCWQECPKRRWYEDKTFPQDSQAEQRCFFSRPSVRKSFLHLVHVWTVLLAAEISFLPIWDCCTLWRRMRRCDQKIPYTIEIIIQSVTNVLLFLVLYDAPTGKMCHKDSSTQNTLFNRYPRDLFKNNVCAIRWVLLFSLPIHYPSPTLINPF